MVHGVYILEILFCSRTDKLFGFSRHVCLTAAMSWKLWEWRRVFVCLELEVDKIRTSERLVNRLVHACIFCIEYFSALSINYSTSL